LCSYRLSVILLNCLKKNVTYNLGELVTLADTSYKGIVYKITALEQNSAYESYTLSPVYGGFGCAEPAFERTVRTTNAMEKLDIIKVCFEYSKFVNFINENFRHQCGVENGDV